jgi:hypothetical protein
MPYFVAAAILRLRSANLEAVSSAGSGEVAVGDGGGAVAAACTAADAGGWSILGVDQKHIGAPFWYVRLS